MAIPDACDWFSLFTVLLTCLLTLSEFLGWTQRTEVNSVSQAIVRVASQFLEDSPCTPRPIPDSDPAHETPVSAPLI
jgi:hypothetical protein